MYFKRKIDSILDKWITKDNRMPLLLIGIRQCGKTESIRELAKRHNLNLIEINFWNNSDYINDFNENLDVDTIISNLSLRFPK